MKRVDAHQHFWQLQRGDYGWLTPASGVLYRDFGPADFDAASTGTGIGRTVLVQAAATEAETRFLLELARTHPRIAGVVGWVDFESAEVAQRITALLEESAGRLRGLRPMVQDLPDPRWLERPDIEPAFEVMSVAGLSFDALVRPEHLPSLHSRLLRHPALRVVIDHCGKPDIAGGGFDAWARAMARIAGETSVHCKLSGLLTEAAPDAGIEDLMPYVRHVLACFGPGRVLWGSDWPVVTLRASYREWLHMAIELVQRLAPGQEQAIFSDNAMRFYRLGE